MAQKLRKFPCCYHPIEQNAGRYPHHQIVKGGREVVTDEVGAAYRVRSLVRGAAGG